MVKSGADMTRNSHTVDDHFRTGKAYTIAQAAALARVNHQTVRYWVYGSAAPQDRREPVFGLKSRRAGEVAQVSFLELVEIIVAARFRAKRIRLSRVREAHGFARAEWEMEHPFASLDLDSIGGHLLARFENEHPDATGGRESFVVLSSPEQLVLPPMVSDELKRFDYDDARFAERWHMFGREIPVVVDPHVAGGRPTIKGSNVSVDIIHKRWKSGEKVAYIAYDFQLRRADVEAVLQHVA
jgi:uncharacterized protein (DUF433 family)